MCCQSQVEEAQLSSAVSVTEASFEAEVIMSPVVTVADLWAEWCGPCKRLGPVLDEIAAEHPKDLKMVKLDVDSNPNLPAQYGVMSIPTLLVFKNGQLVDTMVGFMPKDRILDRVLPHIG
jgi:thioredoxin 1